MNIIFHVAQKIINENQTVSIVLSPVLSGETNMENISSENITLTVSETDDKYTVGKNYDGSLNELN